MNQRHPLMKCIASSVVFTFFITSLGVTPETFAATGVSAAEVSGLTAATLAIPAELGQVTETVMGDPKVPAFIHIQSAHGNYSAEKNIEKLLGHIEKNSSVKLMLLEGAANKLQPELFRLFPKHPDFNRKVTDKLMREGYLTGPEVFMINSPGATRNEQRATDGEKSLSVARNTLSAMQAYGVEDVAAYKKDRDAFIKVVKGEKTAEKYIASLRASIDKRFTGKLNKDLQNLVRQEESFGSGTVSFEGWLKTLGEGSKKHLKTDLSDAFYQDQYPHLIRYYRLQVIGSKIDRELAMKEKDLFLAELERRHISKDIIKLFQDGYQDGATHNAQRATDERKSLSVERSTLRAADGYSLLRRAFDNVFEKLPKDFSMKAWPAWTLYAQHLILMQELEGKGLHEETVKLKDRIFAALAKTPAEKEYLVAARKLYLLRRLFQLELTRAEFVELRDRHISPDELAAGLQTTDQRPQTQSKRLQSPVSSLQSVFAKAVEFYETAIIREERMFSNAVARMTEQKQNRAVIVTGGFHSDGLRELVKSRKGSYIQITPRITEVTKRDHEIYLRQILGTRDTAHGTRSAQVVARDAKASQMSGVLGITRAEVRAQMTNPEASQAWRAEIRRVVDDLISIEPVSAQPTLSRVFSASLLTDGIPETKRSEARGAFPPANTQYFMSSNDEIGFADITDVFSKADLERIGEWVRSHGYVQQFDLSHEWIRDPKSDHWWEEVVAVSFFGFDRANQNKEGVVLIGRKVVQRKYSKAATPSFPLSKIRNESGALIFDVINEPPAKAVSPTIPDSGARLESPRAEARSTSSRQARVTSAQEKHAKSTSGVERIADRKGLTSRRLPLSAKKLMAAATMGLTAASAFAGPVEAGASFYAEHPVASWILGVPLFAGVLAAVYFSVWRIASPISWFIWKLGSIDYSVRENAKSKLESLGSRAAPALIQVLNSSDFPRISGAVGVLKKSNDPWTLDAFSNALSKAVPFLLDSLSSGHSVAANALVEIDDPKLASLKRYFQWIQNNRWSDNYNILTAEEVAVVKANFVQGRATEAEYVEVSEVSHEEYSSDPYAGSSSTTVIDTPASLTVRIIGSSPVSVDAGRQSESASTAAQLVASTVVARAVPASSAAKAPPVPNKFLAIEEPYAKDVLFWDLKVPEFDASRDGMNVPELQDVMALLQQRNWLWDYFSVANKDVNARAKKRIEAVRSRIPAIISTLYENGIISRTTPLVSLEMAGSYLWADVPNDLDLVVVVAGERDFETISAEKLVAGSKPIIAGLETAFDVVGLETLKKAVKGAEFNYSKVIRRKAAVYSSSALLAGVDLFAAQNIPIENYVTMREDLIINARNARWNNIQGSETKIAAKRRWRQTEVDAMGKWLEGRSAEILAGVAVSVDEELLRNAEAYKASVARMVGDLDAADRDEVALLVKEKDAAHRAAMDLFVRERGAAHLNDVARLVSEKNAGHRQEWFLLVLARVPAYFTKLRTALNELEPLVVKGDLSPEQVTAAITEKKQKYSLSEDACRVLRSAFKAPAILSARSEARQMPAQEKKFQKAMSDLKAKLFDGWFNRNGMGRRISAAETLGELKDIRAINALIGLLGNPSLLKSSAAALLQIRDARLVELERYLAWIHGARGNYNIMDRQSIQHIQTKLTQGEPLKGTYREEPASSVIKYYKTEEVSEYQEDPHSYQIGSSSHETEISRQEFERNDKDGPSEESGGGRRTVTITSYFQRQEPVPPFLSFEVFRSESRRDPYAEDFADRYTRYFQNRKSPILQTYRQVATVGGPLVNGPYRVIYELIAGLFGVEQNSDDARAEEGKNLLAMIYQDPQRDQLLAAALAAAEDLTFVASSAQRFYPLMPVINNIRGSRDLFDPRGLAELINQDENGRLAHEYLATAPSLYTGGALPKVRLKLPFSRERKLRVLDIGSAPKAHGSMPLNALRSVLGNEAEIHGTDIFFPVLQIQNGKVQKGSAYRFGPDHSAQVGGVRYWDALKNPQADFLNEKFDLGKFDIITLAKMLHHVDKRGQDRGPRTLSTRKLVYEKAGQEVGSYQETYLITESQQKAIDRLLGALEVGGVLFLNLTYATWSSRSGPDDLAWRQASRMAVVEKANHDIFIVIQREGEDAFRIYDEVIPFRAEDDHIDSLRMGFFDERTVDQWFLGDAPVIKWGRGRKALMRLKENRAEDAGLLAETVKIFAEADQLAYLNQRLNHAIWGQIFKAMEKRDQGGALSEILDTYLKNVPDSSARTALLVRAGQLESKLISRSEVRQDSSRGEFGKTLGRAEARAAVFATSDWAGIKQHLEQTWESIRLAHNKAKEGTPYVIADPSSPVGGAEGILEKRLFEGAAGNRHGAQEPDEALLMDPNPPADVVRPGFVFADDSTQLISKFPINGNGWRLAVAGDGELPLGSLLVPDRDVPLTLADEQANFDLLTFHANTQFRGYVNSWGVGGLKRLHDHVFPQIPKAFEELPVEWSPSKSAVQTGRLTGYPVDSNVLASENLQELASAMASVAKAYMDAKRPFVVYLMPGRVVFIPMARSVLRRWTLEKDFLGGRWLSTLFLFGIAPFPKVVLDKLNASVWADLMSRIGTKIEPVVLPKEAPVLQERSSVKAAGVANNPKARITPEERKMLEEKGQRIFDYLAAREEYVPGQAPEKAWSPANLDSIQWDPSKKYLAMVLGSWDDRTAREAARVVKALRARGADIKVLTSGKYGGKPGLFYDSKGNQLPEAIEYKQLMEKEGVRVDFLEPRSTNSGQNIVFSKQVLDEAGFKPDTILLMQTPILQRRAGVTVVKQYFGDPKAFDASGIRLISYAPYIPASAAKRDSDLLRDIGFALTEIQSLKEYPRKGYTIPAAVPDDISSLAQELESVVLGIRERSVFQPGALVARTFEEKELDLEIFEPKDLDIGLEISSGSFTPEGKSRFAFDRVNNQVFFDGQPVKFSESSQFGQFRETDEMQRTYATGKAGRDIFALPSGNLGMNNFYIAARKDKASGKGKVFFYANDPLVARPMLVVKSGIDGGKSQPEVMTVSFRKEADGTVRMIDPSGEDITDSVEIALYGLPVVREGRLNLKETLSQLDDLRHLFRFPRFDILEADSARAEWVDQVHLGMTDGVGIFYKDPDLRARLFSGRPVTLSVEPLLARGVTFDEIKAVYEAWGYRGRYQLDTAARTVTATYEAGTHPHSYFGITQNGKVFIGALSGALDTHFKGITFAGLFEQLRERPEFAKDPVQYVWVWANGKDVSFRPKGAATKGLRSRNIENLFFSKPSRASQTATGAPSAKRSEARGDSDAKYDVEYDVGEEYENMVHGTPMLGHPRHTSLTPEEFDIIYHGGTPPTPSGDLQPDENRSSVRALSPGASDQQPAAQDVRSEAREAVGDDAIELEVQGLHSERDADRIAAYRSNGVRRLWGAEELKVVGEMIDSDKWPIYLSKMWDPSINWDVDNVYEADGSVSNYLRVDVRQKEIGALTGFLGQDGFVGIRDAEVRMRILNILADSLRASYARFETAVKELSALLASEPFQKDFSKAERLKALEDIGNRSEARSADSTASPQASSGQTRVTSAQEKQFQKVPNERQSLRSESREGRRVDALTIQRNPLRHPVVAIDGPSASGKGTVARLVAQKLGFGHIELGVLNRAIAEKALLEKVDLNDPEAIESLLRQTEVRVEYQNGKTTIVRDGLPLTESIRSPEVGNAAPVISRHRAVLQWVFQTGREIGEAHPMVIEGRNVGTDVFPEVSTKFFLTADLAVRAQRRLRDFIKIGKAISPEQVASDLLLRDRIDSERPIAPFRKAEGAFEIDNTTRPPEETAEIILEKVRELGGATIRSEVRYSSQEVLEAHAKHLREPAAHVDFFTDEERARLNMLYELLAQGSNDGAAVLALDEKDLALLLNDIVMISRKFKEVDSDYPLDWGATISAWRFSVSENRKAFRALQKMLRLNPSVFSNKSLLVLSDPKSALLRARNSTHSNFYGKVPTGPWSREIAIDQPWQEVFDAAVAKAIGLFDRARRSEVLTQDNSRSYIGEVLRSNGIAKRLMLLAAVGIMAVGCESEDDGGSSEGDYDMSTRANVSGGWTAWGDARVSGNTFINAGNSFGWASATRSGDFGGQGLHIVSSGNARFYVSGPGDNPGWKKGPFSGNTDTILDVPVGMNTIAISFGSEAWGGSLNPVGASVTIALQTLTPRSEMRGEARLDPQAVRSEARAGGLRLVLSVMAAGLLSGCATLTVDELKPEKSLAKIQRIRPPQSGKSVKDHQLEFLLSGLKSTDEKIARAAADAFVRTGKTTVPFLVDAAINLDWFHYAGRTLEEYEGCQRARARIYEILIKIHDPAAFELLKDAFKNAGSSGKQKEIGLVMLQVDREKAAAFFVEWFESHPGDIVAFDAMVSMKDRALIPYLLTRRDRFPWSYTVSGGQTFVLGSAFDSWYADELKRIKERLATVQKAQDSSVLDVLRRDAAFLISCFDSQREGYEKKSIAELLSRFGGSSSDVIGSFWDRKDVQSQVDAEVLLTAKWNMGNTSRWPLSILYARMDDKKNLDADVGLAVLGAAREGRLKNELDIWLRKDKWANHKSTLSPQEFERMTQDLRETEKVVFRILRLRPGHNSWAPDCAPAELTADAALEAFVGTGLGDVGRDSFKQTYVYGLSDQDFGRLLEGMTERQKVLFRILRLTRPNGSARLASTWITDQSLESLAREGRPQKDIAAIFENPELAALIPELENESPDVVMQLLLALPTQPPYSPPEVTLAGRDLAYVVSDIYLNEISRRSTVAKLLLEAGADYSEFWPLKIVEKTVFRFNWSNAPDISVNLHRISWTQEDVPALKRLLQSPYLFYREMAGKALKKIGSPVGESRRQEVRSEVRTQDNSRSYIGEVLRSNGIAKRLMLLAAVGIMAVGCESEDDGGSSEGDYDMSTRANVSGGWTAWGDARVSGNTFINAGNSFGWASATRSGDFGGQGLHIVSSGNARFYVSGPGDNPGWKKGPFSGNTDTIVDIPAGMSGITFHFGSTAWSKGLNPVGASVTVQTLDALTPRSELRAEIPAVVRAELAADAGMSILEDQTYQRVRAPKNEADATLSHYLNFIEERIPAKWIKSLKEDPNAFIELFPGHIAVTGDKVYKKYGRAHAAGQMRQLAPFTGKNFVQGSTRLQIETLFETKVAGNPRYLMTNLPGLSTLEQTLAFLKFAGVPCSKILIHAKPPQGDEFKAFDHVLGSIINDVDAIVFGPVHGIDTLEAILDQDGRKTPLPSDQEKIRQFPYGTYSANAAPSHMAYGSVIPSGDFTTLVLNTRSIFGQAAEGFMEWLVSRRPRNLRQIFFYGTSGGIKNPGQYDPASPSCASVNSVVIPDHVALDVFGSKSYQPEGFDNQANDWQNALREENVKVIAGTPQRPVTNITTANVGNETLEVAALWEKMGAQSVEMELYYLVKGAEALKKTGVPVSLYGALRVFDVLNTPDDNAAMIKRREDPVFQQAIQNVDKRIGEAIRSSLSKARSELRMGLSEASEKVLNGAKELIGDLKVIETAAARGRELAAQVSPEAFLAAQEVLKVPAGQFAARLPEAEAKLREAFPFIAEMDSKPRYGGATTIWSHSRRIAEMSDAAGNDPGVFYADFEGIPFKGERLTPSVWEAYGELGRKVFSDPENRLALRLATVFHDIGILVQMPAHEPVGALVLKEILDRLPVSDKVKLLVLWSVGNHLNIGVMGMGERTPKYALDRMSPLPESLRSTANAILVLLQAGEVRSLVELKDNGKFFNGRSGEFYINVADPAKFDALKAHYGEYRLKMFSSNGDWILNAGKYTEVMRLISEEMPGSERQQFFDYLQDVNEWTDYGVYIAQEMSAKSLVMTHYLLSQVALLEGNKIRNFRWSTPRGDAKTAALGIENFLNENHVTFNDLTLAGRSREEVQRILTKFRISVSPDKRAIRFDSNSFKSVTPAPASRSELRASQPVAKSFSRRSSVWMVVLAGIAAFFLTAREVFAQAFGVPNKPTITYTEEGDRRIFVKEPKPDGSYGLPYALTMKGANWGPTSVGIDPQWNPIGYRQEMFKGSTNDIPMMAAMGANVTRPYYDPGTNAQAIALLDQFYKHGIKVIMPVDAPFYGQIARTNNIAGVVNTFKNHPAILGWGIGNEWNINYYYNTFTTLQDSIEYTERAAQIVKNLDSNHVVVTFMADPHIAQWGRWINGEWVQQPYNYGPETIGTPGDGSVHTIDIVNNLPSIDVFGWQIYRGWSFGDAFSQLAKVTTRPAFISEFGADAYSHTLDGVNEQAQADFNRGLWDEVVFNLASGRTNGVVSGVLAFEWNDEWHKNAYPWSHAASWEPNGGQPDGYNDEEWFGLLDIERNPRLAYYALMQRFLLGGDAAIPLVTNPVLKVTSGVTFELNGKVILSRGGAGAGARGLNIAILDEKTGIRLKEFKHFDTYTYRYNSAYKQTVADYLNAIPDGSVVMIGVADNSGLTDQPSSSAPIYQALEALGSTQVRTAPVNTWTMITKKGSGKLAETSTADPITATVSLTALDANAGLREAPVPVQAPVIKGLKLENGNFQIPIQTQPGFVYQIEYRDDLATGDWRLAQRGLVSDGTSVSWTDDGSFTGGALPGQRFYRVKVIDRVNLTEQPGKYDMGSAQSLLGGPWYTWGDASVSGNTLINARNDYQWASAVVVPEGSIAGKGLHVVTTGTASFYVSGQGDNPSWKMGPFPANTDTILDLPADATTVVFSFGAEAWGVSLNPVGASITVQVLDALTPRSEVRASQFATKVFGRQASIFSLRSLALLATVGIMAVGCEDDSGSDEPETTVASSPSSSPSSPSTSSPSTSHPVASEPSAPSGEAAAFEAAKSSVAAMDQFVNSYIAARGYVEAKQGWSEGVAGWYASPAQKNISYSYFANEFSRKRLEALASVGMLKPIGAAFRSEVRLDSAQEKQFQKAMWDLQPRWSDRWFKESAVNRKVTAAKKLGELRDARAASALIGMWSSSAEETVRIAAVEALGVMEDPITVLSMVLVQEESAAVRKVAIKRLQAVAALGILGQGIKSKYPDVRLAAVTALGELNEWSNVELLVAKLNDPDRDVRSASVKALYNMKSLSGLAAALQNGDESVRRLAVAYLCHLDALTELGRELGNAYPDVRSAAAIARGDLKDVSAVPALVKLLNDRAVSDVAAAALEKIADPRSASALAEYKEMLAQEEKERAEREEADRLERERIAAESSSSDDDYDQGPTGTNWAGITGGILHGFVPFPLIALAGNEAGEASHIGGWDVLVLGLAAGTVLALGRIFIRHQRRVSERNRLAEIANRDHPAVRIAEAAAIPVVDEARERFEAYRAQAVHNLPGYPDESDQRKQVAGGDVRVRSEVRGAITAGDLADANLLLSYLAEVAEVPKNPDVLLVLGNPDHLRNGADAARIYHELNPRWVLVAGKGKGVRAEALEFQDVLVANGVPAEKILIEDQSMNTGQNAQFGSKVLREDERVLASGMLERSISVAVTQKPVSERLSTDIMRKQFAWPRPIAFFPVAPRVPQVNSQTDPEEFYGLVAEALDQMGRFTAFAEKGFIDVAAAQHPAEILGVVQRLTAVLAARSEMRTGWTTDLRPQTIARALSLQSPVSSLESEVPPQVLPADTSSIGAKIGTAMRVAANTVSPLLSSTPAYAGEVAPVIFAGTSHFQTVPRLAGSFGSERRELARLVARTLEASAGFEVVDQRSSIPDVASVLPLADLVRYNPKASIVLALVGVGEVETLRRALVAAGAGDVLGKNLKVEAFATAREFLGRFNKLRDANAASGVSMAFVTDGNIPALAEVGNIRAGKKSRMLRVNVGASGDKKSLPLQQTACVIGSAVKLLDDKFVDANVNRFVSIADLGVTALLAEFTSQIAAAKRTAASA